jgi:integrase
VFYEWTVAQGHVAVSPASHLVTPPRPKAVPKALSVTQVRVLLLHLDVHAPDGLRELRDRALLLTGLYTGMRALELAELEWGKLDLIERVVTITIAKMNKGRSVRMHPDLVPTLTTWCDAQGFKGDHDAPVFSLDRKEKKAIVANRVGKVARHYAKLLDIPLTAHTLRHTFATWSLRRSGNIYSVSKALGHARLAQTEVYLRSDPSDSDDAVGSLPSLGDW